MILREFIKIVKNDRENDSNKMSGVTHTIKSVAKKYKDEFYNFIKDEPSFDSKEFGTFVAGLIELLCNYLKINPPGWIFDKKYYLDKPYSKLYGYNRIPNSLVTCTLFCFSSRNYYTNENGILV